MIDFIVEAFTTNLIKTLLNLALLPIAVAFSTNIKSIFWRFINFFKTLGKDIVLIWVDDEDYVGNNIAEALHARNNHYHFIALKKATDILHYRLSKKRIAMVMFFITDVSKITPETAKGEKIQEKILKYVKKGGYFLGSHDALYRRVNLEKFQSAFGCKITEFSKQTNPVHYKIAAAYKNHPLTEGLPLDTPMLIEDNEICWGDWDDTVEQVLYTDLNRKKIPLFTYKPYSKGKLFWINAGDKTDQGTSMSLRKPDTHILRILCNALNYERK